MVEGNENLSDVTNADFAIEAFQNWLRITAQGFQDRLGLETAIEVMRPYSVNAAIALANNLSAALGTEKKGIENLAYQWEVADLIMGMEGMTEITPYGTRTEITSCPFASGPAILCIAHFNQVPEAWAHYMVPDLMHRNFVESLYKGDSRCFGYCSSISAVKAVLSAPVLKTIKITDSSKLDTTTMRSLFLTDFWEFFLTMFVDQVGSQEVVAVLGPKFYDLGIRDWEKMNMDIENGKEQRPLQRLMSVFAKKFGQECGAIVQTRSSLQGEVHKCPFSNCHPEMCLLIGEYLKGLCHAAETGSKFSYIEMMTNGSSKCIWKIDLGIENEPIDRKDDLVYRLKLRLVNGEISKEEYRELYDLVKE